MANPARLDLQLVNFDEEVVEFELVDAAGTPINITGRDYTLEVRANPASTDAADCTFTCTVPVGTDGIVVATADPSETENLIAGNAYYWSLLEDELYTLITGRVNVIQQVTKAGN
jgi:hypothetical protein